MRLYCSSTELRPRQATYCQILFQVFLLLIQTKRLSLSNGHSPANLSNSSTRRKFASLANASTHQNALFWKLGRTRYIRPTFANYFPRTRYIRQTFASPFSGLDTFARHSPTLFPGLDTFAKGKFRRI